MTGPDGIARLLLLRHAETADPGRFHGCESDVALGPRGHQQAEAVADWIAGWGPDAVYASNLRRARDTAGPIATRCGLSLRLVPELHERRMGPMSGVPRAEGWAAYVVARDRWIAGDLDATHPGGESYRAIRDRAAPSLEAIARAHRGGRAAVVAHGVVIRVLLSSLVDGFSPARWDELGIDFVAVNELEWDGRRWHARSLNRRVIDPSLVPDASILDAPTPQRAPG